MSNKESPEFAVVAGAGAAAVVAAAADVALATSADEMRSDTDNANRCLA